MKSGLVDAHLHVWRAITDHPDPLVTIVTPLSDIPIELAIQYLNEHGIDRAVLVQPLYLGEDNSYVADCAARQPERFAAVCVVDPRNGDAADRLEYWVRERGCKGVRLRPRLPDEATCFGDPRTYPLWERAQALNIVVSVLAGQEHLDALISLAIRYPDVPIVIDHMAHPDVTAGPNSPQFQKLLYLAQYPQVYVKVTGYYYFSQQPYPYQDCWDFFPAVYDRFGPDRLLWGSDFPHVLLKTGYRRNLSLQERVYSFLTSHDLDLIMGENAARLYWGE